MDATYYKHLLWYDRIRSLWRHNTYSCVLGSWLYRIRFVNISALWLVPDCLTTSSAYYHRKECIYTAAQLVSWLSHSLYYRITIILPWKCIISYYSLAWYYVLLKLTHTQCDIIITRVHNAVGQCIMLQLCTGDCTNAAQCSNLHNPLIIIQSIVLEV
jgi:hypothetical protein